MTALAFKAAGTGVDTGNPAIPTHVAGDLIVFIIESNAVATKPADYFLIGTAPSVTTTLAVYGKIATSSSESAPVVAGTSDHYWAVVLLYEGVHQTGDLGAGDSPITAVATTISTAATTAAHAPGLRTRIDGSMVVHVLSWAADNAGPIASSWANADLASTTERYDAGTTGGGGGGITVADGIDTTAGALGFGTATITSTNFAAVTFAIRPAGEESIAGTVTIDGAPAPDGGLIEIWDDAFLVVHAIVTLDNGDGTFAVTAPASDYYVMYDDLAGVRGVSAAGDPSSDAFDIAIVSGGGAGAGYSRGRTVNT